VRELHEHCGEKSRECFIEGTPESAAVSIGRCFRTAPWVEQIEIMAAQEEDAFSSKVLKVRFNGSEDYSTRCTNDVLA